MDALAYLAPLVAGISTGWLLSALWRKWRDRR